MALMLRLLELLLPPRIYPLACACAVAILAVILLCIKTLFSVPFVLGQIPFVLASLWPARLTSYTIDTASSRCLTGHAGTCSRASDFGLVTRIARRS
ncbi:hypothetical protein F5X99DRAFT_383008 [Biscogniauxia marginata]|nr:hypothetical protein F5X99DRAFT_383008 [Biscogniauxia marginata]